MEKKHILLVEDNELNTKLFLDLLKSEGYTVAHSSSGAEVVNLVEMEKPNLILMDIQLPEISGIDLIKTLKSNERYKDIPIVVITAFAMRGDEDDFLNMGASGYVPKPISIDKFLSTVKEFIV